MLRSRTLLLFNSKLNNHCIKFTLRQRNSMLYVGVRAFSNDLSKPGDIAPVPLDDAMALLREPFDPRFIRNFSIIAHIDHGKTTLSGALLRRANVIADDVDSLYLDKLSTEKERGITIKAHICSFFIKSRDQIYLCNLIDTPGHVDFHYEVSRALKACEGAVLLVDSTQGIQAQTLANYNMSTKASLAIIPALNKIDSPNANVDRALEQLTFDLELDPRKTQLISAKRSLGIDSLLQAVVDDVPPPHRPPADTNDEGLMALLVDSHYDRYDGVVCLVRIFKGRLANDSVIKFASNGKAYQVARCGVMMPNAIPTDALTAGMVGFVVCGMRDTREARVGDTILHETADLDTAFVLDGFEQPQPMLFAGIFPEDGQLFEQLRDAVNRLSLNDPSVRVTPCSSTALGAGFRCGFLGALHFEVFVERLQAEHEITVVSTSPTVPFMVRKRDGSETIHDNPADFPTNDQLHTCQVLEPRCHATVICPSTFQGNVMTLMSEARGEPLGVRLVGSGEVASVDEASNDEFGASAALANSVQMEYSLPLAAVISDGLPSKLKASTRGFASLDYVLTGYEEADLVRLDILVHGEAVDAFSRVVARDDARKASISVLQRLKELLPRQQFHIALQAAIGTKILARETVKQVRKNVTAKLYGGDVTRKMKLLEKQKEGKKRMKSLGGVTIEHDVFLQILSRDKSQ